jgi:trigger factor
VTLPELNDDFAKTVGAGETLEQLRDAVRKDVENRSRADYDDKYFVDLIEKIKEGATLKYHQHALEHEGEHVLEELSQRLSQQNMDLETYFKLRNTTREKFIEEEVQPVAKKRFERSLILDEIVRSENIQVDNEALDSEFNQTLNSLAMQGVDLNKIKGGRQGQQRMAQAVAMESANRVLTRRALDVLKSIATGEYVPPQERNAEELQSEAVETQSVSEEAAAPRQEVSANEDLPPESERLIDTSNEAESKSE